MSAINTAVYVVHILSVITILALLVMQWKKHPRRLNPAILHAGLTALIAGLTRVGISSSLYPDETLNNTKIGVKLLILILILVIGYRNVKKPELSKNTWLTLVGLTITNILIASLWR